MGGHELTPEMIKAMEEHKKPSQTIKLGSDRKRGPGTQAVVTVVGGYVHHGKSRGSSKGSRATKWTVHCSVHGYWPAQTTKKIADEEAERHWKEHHAPIE